MRSKMITRLQCRRVDVKVDHWILSHSLAEFDVDERELSWAGSFSDDFLRTGPTHQNYSMTHTHSYALDGDFMTQKCRLPAWLAEILQNTNFHVETIREKYNFPISTCETSNVDYTALLRGVDCVSCGLNWKLDVAQCVLDVSRISQHKLLCCSIVSLFHFSFWFIQWAFYVVLCKFWMMCCVDIHILRVHFNLIESSNDLMIRDIDTIDTL